MNSANLKFIVFFFMTFISISKTDFIPELNPVTVGNNKFANKLFEQLVKESEENLFFSPISAHAILSLLYQGSKGETLLKLANVLNVPEPTQTAENYKNIMTELNNAQNVTLYIGNKIWIANYFKLKSSFKSSATNQFFAEAESINFFDNKVAANLINNWVEQKTNKKINNLISSDMIDPSTLMVLVNAIYYKGDWKYKFNKLLTSKFPFHIDSVRSLKVDMMNMYDINLPYAEYQDLDCKVVKIPYANDDFSLVIVLPNKIDGIEGLQRNIAAVDWNTLIQNLEGRKLEILSIPKFKIETTIFLKNILQKIGLDIIFSNQANFSNLFEVSSNIKVSNAIQKSFLEVNEEGSEVTSVFGMLMSAKLMMPLPMSEKISFEANHPFLFQIIYKNNIIFMGKVVNP